MTETKTSIRDDSEAQRQYAYMEHCRFHVAALGKELGRTPRAAVITFGCQMNAHDSEKLTGILSQCGYEMTEDEGADLVIYNTCTVRDHANQRLYGRLGAQKALKEARPYRIIALCGCMMQQEEAVEKIKKSYPFVDLIFGTFNLYRLAELLCAVFNQGGMIIDISQGNGAIEENDLPSSRKYPFKSGVNIMYGCNNFCSYCIVPYVRGRERSRRMEDILAEIRALAEDGVKEVMLLGQNVNSYGKTLDPPVSFATLLRNAEQIEGIERIRFMTSHPKDLSDGLIDTMAHSSKICRHLHLPLQSGSNRILKAMNRQYTKEQYLALTDKIKSAMPDIALTTDIIVGFPGETPQDVDETIDVIRKVEFDNAFTFLYSKRAGTPAAKMPQQVPKEKQQESFDRLLRVVQKTARWQVAKLQGLTLPALVEEINPKDPALLTGRLSNNTLVHFPGSKSLIGQIVNVRLAENRGFYYLGEMVE